MILHQMAQGMASGVALEGARVGLRVALGGFFAISGFHKLFNKDRRAALKATFDADHVKGEAEMMFAIPMGEMFGGMALLSGFMMPVAAIGLIAICLGACALDGRKRVADWKPLDPADRLDDWLYLPELLYVVMLAVLVILGAGQLSIDAMI